MKKFLLISALLSVEFSNAANAEKESGTPEGIPKFSISGSAGFHMGFPGSPNNDYYAGSDAKDSKDSSTMRCSAGEAEIVFSAVGFLQNGWMYGAKLAMDAMKEDTGIDKMYLIFEKSSVGTFHFGNVKGPDATMVRGGQQLIGGTTGMDGTVPNDITLAAGVISPINLVGYTGKATKLAYYSPKFAGFQIGFAFTPDTGHVGHMVKSNGLKNIGNDGGICTDKSLGNKLSGRSSLAFGLSHKHKFDNGISTTISAVSVFDNARKVLKNEYKILEENSLKASDQNLSINNTKSYYISGQIGYKDLTFGAGYMNNGKSRLPSKTMYTENNPLNEKYAQHLIATKESNAGRSWNVGAQYKFQKFIFSAVYHSTKRKITTDEHAKGNMFTFSTEYVLCPGLKVFAEYDHIHSKSTNTACEIYNRSADTNKKNAIEKQNANVFVLGALVAF